MFPTEFSMMPRPLREYNEVGDPKNDAKEKPLFPLDVDVRDSRDPENILNIILFIKA